MDRDREKIDSVQGLGGEVSRQCPVMGPLVQREGRRVVGRAENLDELDSGDRCAILSIY